MDFLNKIFSGKNIKFIYFAKGFLRDIFPHKPEDIEKIIQEAKKRSDWPYIRERVLYCCKQQGPAPTTSKRVCDIKRHDCASSYYFDLKQWMRPFPQDTSINFLPGDITHVPPVATLTKSRPIAGDNANSVLLKLNQIRHFIFVNDKLSFEDKKPIAIFRGKLQNNSDKNIKSKRKLFFEKYWGDPCVDLGDTSRHGNSEWHTERLTIPQQLHYRYILSLEGNDVASNLKWAMSSNSIAVMPEPEYETWFMEGRLKPNVHYLVIKKDYSDLHEVLDHADNNPDLVQFILKNAHEYVNQFKDKEREELISTLVVARYLGYVL